MEIKILKDKPAEFKEPTFPCVVKCTKDNDIWLVTKSFREEAKLCHTLLTTGAQNTGRTWVCGVDDYAESLKEFTARLQSGRYKLLDGEIVVYT